jgi:hypothetical protein
MTRRTFAMTMAALASVVLLPAPSAAPLAAASAQSPAGQAGQPTATGASPKSSPKVAPAAAKSPAVRPTSANQYIDVIFGGPLQEEIKAAKLDPTTGTMNSIEFSHKVRSATAKGVFDFPVLSTPGQGAAKPDNASAASTPPCSIVGVSKIQRLEAAALSGSFTKKILFGWQIADIIYECKGKFRYGRQPTVNIKADCAVTVTGKGEIQKKGDAAPELTQLTISPPKCDPKFTGLGSQKYPDKVNEDFARNVVEVMSAFAENSLKPALARAVPQTPFPPVTR